MTTREEIRRRGQELQQSMDHRARRPAGVAVQPPGAGGASAAYTGELVFGAVWARPGLELRYRMIATLSLLTCLQRLNQLRSYVWSSLNIGLKPEEILEVLTQCSFYAGVPSYANSGEVARDVFRERGVELPAREAPTDTLEEMEARGRALYSRLLGGASPQADILAAQAIAPDLERLLMQYCFGGVLHEPGLDLKSRMVCSIAALTTLRMDPPLGYFLKAGLQAGLTREELLEVIIQIAPYGGFPAAMFALTVAQQHL